MSTITLILSLSLSLTLTLSLTLCLTLNLYLTWRLSLALSEFGTAIYMFAYEEGRILGGECPMSGGGQVNVRLPPSSAHIRQFSLVGIPPVGIRARTQQF